MPSGECFAKGGDSIDNQTSHAVSRIPAIDDPDPYKDACPDILFPFVGGRDGAFRKGDIYRREEALYCYSNRPD
jgi:hypothetical protein